MNSFNNFFQPRSVAVVGASEEAGKIGTIISKNLLELGYKGTVYFVNPKYENLYGKKCFSSLESISEEVDLAIIAIPAKFVQKTIELGAQKVKNFVIISAGFGESGVEGLEREKALKELIKKYNINVLGPNCLGFIKPSLKLNASFAPVMPGAGSIGFISQSGALISAIVDKARLEKINFSNIISVGNKVDIDEAKLLEHFDQDDETKVIGMYLEGIGNGQEFLLTAEKVSKRKPIVLIKAGKGERTQKAISSHTGALAGSRKVMEAAVTKAGIILVEDLEEFFDTVNYLAKNEAPKTPESAIITNAGGLGVLATDAFEGKKVKLFNFSNETKAVLGEFLPSEATLNNPIDVLGDAQVDRYQKTLKALDEIESIGTILVLLTPQAQTPVNSIAEAIIEFKGKTSKNLAVIFLGGEKVSISKDKLSENGISIFNFPEAAVKAIERYWQWKEYSLKSKKEENYLNEARSIATQKFLNEVISKRRFALTFMEAKELIKPYGINSVKAEKVKLEKLESLTIHFPIVLKVDSDLILHKTDRKGVYLNINNLEELRSATQELNKNFPGSDVIAEPMEKRQTEMILGLKKDAVFGSVVLFGLGGIYTEVFNIAELLVLPVSLSDIQERLRNGKLGFLFKETRGQKAYDLESVSKIILGIAELSIEAPMIEEMDINPVLVYNDGSPDQAVDIKIILNGKYESRLEN